MEALKNLFNEIGIPYQVLFAISVVVLITEASKDACISLEKYLEEKKGKEIDNSRFVNELLGSQKRKPSVK